MHRTPALLTHCSLQAFKAGVPVFCATVVCATAATCPLLMGGVLMLSGAKHKEQRRQSLEGARRFDTHEGWDGSFATMSLLWNLEFIDVWGLRPL